jgi:predicted amidohydrolase YtcJ
MRKVAGFIGYKYGAKHGTIMITANQKNIDLYLKKIYNIIERSFKMYGDGALGSRGACMHKPYSDKPDQHALLAFQLDKRCCHVTASKFQLNTHAIGDSATQYFVIYSKAFFG